MFDQFRKLLIQVHLARDDSRETADAQDVAAGLVVAVFRCPREAVDQFQSRGDQFGRAAADLLERELATVLDPALADAVRDALICDQESPGTPATLSWQLPDSDRIFSGYVHRSDPLTVLELEPAPVDHPALSDALVQAVRGFSRVRAQTALPAKAQAAAECFRRLTGYDRVMIYRFDEDWHGEVIAEARRADLEPYLGLHYPASDIPAQARRLYLTSPTRVIVDIDYAPSPLLPAVNPVSGQPLDLSGSLLRSVSPVHLEYLRNMGVQATLVASLLREGQLWGLIACHHYAPRSISCAIRELAGWMTQDLSTQIALLEEVRSRRYTAHLKQCRDHTMFTMRQGVRLSDVLRGPELIQLLSTIGAEGAALICGKEVITGGVTPDPHRILEIVAGLSTTDSDDPFGPTFTDCLSQHLPGTADLAATAAGVAMFPLDTAQSMKLIWFRGEQLRQVTWGGNPDKAVDIAPDGRLSPRQSFAAWTEIVRLHSVQWQSEELESARELGALIDIEWRKIAEDALRASEALLKDVLNSLTAHIAVLDGQGVITLVNAAWRRFAEQNGGGADCQPGVDYLAICRGVVCGQDGIEAQAALRGIQQVLGRTQAAFSLKYPCDSPTEARWFEMRVLPLSGSRPGVVIAHEDITAQKLAEDALRDSETRLQRVLDGANDGFWDWNVGTGEVLFSPRWAEMLGYDLAEIEPHIRSWEKRVHPDDLPHCQAAVQAHFAGKTPRYQTEHRLRAKNGEWRWILSRGKITERDAQGRPLRIAGTHTDLTDRRQMEEVLRVSLAEVQRHDAQMVVLNRMNDLLLSCETREEAYGIIADSAQTLFAPYAGGLAVGAGPGADLRLVAAWGDSDWLAPMFSPNDCWALRRGELHEVGPDRDELDCRHFVGRPLPNYLGIPLNVRGEMLGLLHVGAGEILTEAQFQELRTVTIAVSESIKLALSNLKLQEALRKTAL